MMVESKPRSCRKRSMLEAVMFASPAACSKVIDAIIELAEHAAKEPFDVHRPKTLRRARSRQDQDAGRRRHRRRLQDPEASTDRRYAAVDAPTPRRRPLRRSGARSTRTPTGVDRLEDLGAKSSRNLRSRSSCVANILETPSLRIDGRDLDNRSRPIVAEVGVLPRTHGSALFTRGETQALVVATLGTGDDEQFIDSLEGTYK